MSCVNGVYICMYFEIEFFEFPFLVVHVHVVVVESCVYMCPLSEIYLHFSLCI